MTNRNNKSQILELISTLHDKGINPETNELYLHSHIDSEVEEQGIDYRSSISFIKNFNYLVSANDKPIIIHMDSIGGEVDRGLSIYDIIKQEKRGICIVGYGLVASMATTILQAASLRVLLPNSALMLHESTVGGIQHIKAAKSSMKLLQMREELMLEIYAQKCIKGQFFKDRGYNLAKVKSFLNKKMSDNVDWYLDAVEAVSYGLADGILGSKEYPNLRHIMSNL